jgi:hypothetical protein
MMFVIDPKALENYARKNGLDRPTLTWATTSEEFDLMVETLMIKIESERVKANSNGMVILKLTEKMAQLKKGWRTIHTGEKVA